MTFCWEAFHHSNLQLTLFRISPSDYINNTHSLFKIYVLIFCWNSSPCWDKKQTHETISVCVLTMCLTYFWKLLIAFSMCMPFMRREKNYLKQLWHVITIDWTEYWWQNVLPTIITINVWNILIWATLID